ncbi:hypothetical protein ACTG1T_15570 [Aeromonas veronii]|uniref:hypothetical protein n=1 Tax=Aeromonas TaxID=642 RepID=UPI001F2FDA5F|nr:hypothetical protein [Aeromonas veronii]MCF5903232.1 hypothetical protein [Aeromonas veronii]
MKIMTTKEVEVIADIQCDVCHKSTTPNMNPNFYNPQFGSLTAKWGYGSKHDGTAYEVHLCEECFFTVLSQIKNIRINDHAGYVDDQSFGRLLSHSPELI